MISRAQSRHRSILCSLSVSHQHHLAPHPIPQNPAVCVNLNPTHAPLLLRPKSRLPNSSPPQLDPEDPLHSAQDLLIRRRRAPLKILHNRHRRVALGCEIFLRHFRRDLVPPLHDRLSDFQAYGLRLDDLVASVDFGQMLAFDGGFLGTEMSVRAGEKGEEGQYCVGAGELLLCGDDCTAALGSV